MITTVDGVVKKPGQRVWVVGFNIDTNQYQPSLSKIVSQDRVIGDSWDELQLCQEMCDLMNQDQVKVVPATPESYDGKEVDRYMSDEIGQWPTPKKK